MMELEKTLLQMGARPHRRGYLQAVELLRIFRDKPNISTLIRRLAQILRRHRNRWIGI